MTPNEIYALDDLDKKPWYAFINSNDILSECFPVLRKLSVDFDRASTDGADRFSFHLKLHTPVRPGTDSVCLALMFDGRPFGFFTAYMYLSDLSFDTDVDISDSYVYITDSILWRAAEDLVCSYADTPILNKPPFNLPVLASNKDLAFKESHLGLVSVDGMALVVYNWHRTQDEIVAFNALIYHRLLNELIEREGEEKLNQMKWTSRSSIVKEIAHIGLLSVPKGIEARAGVGTVKYLNSRERALAILRFDSGTYGLIIRTIIRTEACLQDYQNSNNIKLMRLGESDVFGSAHERIKWMDEDPRRV